MQHAPGAASALCSHYAAAGGPACALCPPPPPKAHLPFPVDAVALFVPAAARHLPAEMWEGRSSASITQQAGPTTEGHAWAATDSLHCTTHGCYIVASWGCGMKGCRPTQASETGSAATFAHLYRLNRSSLVPFSTVMGKVSGSIWRPCTWASERRAWGAREANGCGRAQAAC